MMVVDIDTLNSSMGLALLAITWPFLVTSWLFASNPKPGIKIYINIYICIYKCVLLLLVDIIYTKGSEDTLVF